MLQCFKLQMTMNEGRRFPDRKGKQRDCDVNKKQQVVIKSRKKQAAALIAHCV
jgi:hypothetical protein